MTRWEAASIESLYAGAQLQSTPGYQHFGSLVGPVNTDQFSSSACLTVSKLISGGYGAQRALVRTVRSTTSSPFIGRDQLAMMLLPRKRVQQIQRAVEVVRRPAARPLPGAARALANSIVLHSRLCRPFGGAR